MQQVKTLGERLVQRLVEDGLINATDGANLLERREREGVGLLTLIAHLPNITEEDLTICMGRVLNVLPVNLRRLKLSPDVVNLIPIAFAKTHKIIPCFRIKDRLFLAMADPMNVLVLDDIKRITNLRVIPLIAPERAISAKLNQPHEKEKPFDKRPIGSAGTEELLRVTEADPEATVIAWTNRILTQAFSARASDIHLEPLDGETRLRFRIDGLLVDQPSPPTEIFLGMVSRLKIISQLDIAERRLPQDGRLRVPIGDQQIDVRSSFVPTINGEKCVLRLLDKSSVPTVDHLGMDPQTLSRFKAALDAPHGLVLVTGPTGSGKTTTLYAAASELNRPSYNVITVEDPVEFQIRGIAQIPINSRIGLTFGSALRAVLRQDPDVIMIGEIRDQETASIAIEAALTGHQILSTIHCNSSVGAVSRLDEMEVPAFLIASALILSCSQRLVRRICGLCREPVGYSADVLQELGVDPKVFGDAQLYKGAGCGHCNGTGYSGRTAIIEAVPITPRLRSLIIRRAPMMELEQTAVAEGMLTMRDLVLVKVRQGETTLEEAVLATSQG